MLPHCRYSHHYKSTRFHIEREGRDVRNGTIIKNTKLLSYPPEDDTVRQRILPGRTLNIVFDD